MDYAISILVTGDQIVSQRYVKQKKRICPCMPVHMIMSHCGQVEHFKVPAHQFQVKNSAGR